MEIHYKKSSFTHLQYLNISQIVCPVTEQSEHMYESLGIQVHHKLKYLISATEKNLLDHPFPEEVITVLEDKKEVDIGNNLGGKQGAT